MTIGTHFFEFKPKELAAGQIHVYTMKFAHEGKLVEAQIAARLPHAEDGSPGGMIAPPVLEVTVGTLGEMVTYKEKEWVGKPFKADETVGVVTKNETGGTILLIGGWFAETKLSPPALVPPPAPKSGVTLQAGETSTFPKAEVQEKLIPRPFTAENLVLGPHFTEAKAIRKTTNEVPVVLELIDVEKMLKLVKKAHGIVHPNEMPALERPLADTLKRVSRENGSAEPEQTVYFTRDQSKTLLKIVRNSWNLIPEVGGDDIDRFEKLFKAAMVHGIVPK